MAKTPEQIVNSNTGWTALTHAMGRTFPRQLAVSMQARRGLRQIMHRKRR